MRNALVTGVSRRAGIGFAIAHRLEEAGAQVFTQGWTPHDAAQPWGADETIAPSIEADFADPGAPAHVVTAAREALGPLDVLVVNHARSGLGRLDELTAEHLDAFLHENVRASLLLVKEFAAQFEGDSGRVVLITSGAHLDAMTGEVAYAVSKGALAIATRTLADGARRARHHRELHQPGPDGDRLGPRRHRPEAAHAVRALGRARRRSAARGVALQ